MHLYDTFKDRSAHLEYWFLAVGNAELTNKMALYTRDQQE
jgi:hypothetical protein